MSETVTRGVDDLDKARSGDNAAFDRLVEPLRRELHAHCYRMLGSSHDAEDALVRAWRGLAAFEARSTLRSWLYTVATRTCLDAVERRARRELPVDLGPASARPVLDRPPLNDVAWLGPYADGGLRDGPAAPEAHYEQREAVEVAFVAALQHLPGNQRAALLLFEVLGFSAAEIATIMDTSTASINSALQRARKLVAERVPERSQQQTLREIDDARLREIVTGFAAALQDGDADSLVELLTADVTWSMPPLADWSTGRESVIRWAVAVPMADCGDWQHIEVTANGQPAVACYLRKDGAGPFHRHGIDVLTIRDARIVEITSFIGSEHFDAFGLPEALD